MAEIEEKEQTEQVENTEQTETAEQTESTETELTEAQLAAAALAEADRPPVEAVAEQRAKKQDAEARATAAEEKLNTTVATLAGQIEALTNIVGKKPDVAVPKSPVEEYIEKNGEEVPLDGKTLLAQEKWHAEQVTAQQTQSQAATVESQKQIIAAAQAEFSADKVGKGMDFNTIVETGAQFLSDGDKVAIRQATPGAVGAETYNRCLDALAKSPLIKSLITSIAAGTKVNNGSEQPTGETNTETPEAPTQDEILKDVPEGTSAAVVNAMAL